MNGELYNSTEDFSSDTRFGLTVNVIRRPIVDSATRSLRSPEKTEGSFLLDRPTDKEMELFHSIHKIKNS